MRALLPFRRVPEARKPRAAALAWSLLAGLSACSQAPLQPGNAHLLAEPARARAVIPEPVLSTPVLPPPVAAPRLETYTVVVRNVPVQELLFALARDAQSKKRAA